MYQQVQTYQWVIQYRGRATSYDSYQAEHMHGKAVYVYLAMIASDD